jgi:hypothetical protein
MWRGLRIVSFVTATITLIILAIVLLGATSFRVPLAAAVITNIAVAIADVIRTFVLRSKLRHSPKS